MQPACCWAFFDALLRCHSPRAVFQGAGQLFHFGGGDGVFVADLEVGLAAGTLEGLACAVAVWRAGCGEVVAVFVLYGGCDLGDCVGGDVD